MATEYNWVYELEKGLNIQQIKRQGLWALTFLYKGDKSPMLETATKFLFQVDSLFAAKPLSLMNYLDYTFRRLIEEKKVAFCLPSTSKNYEDVEWCVWCTGILTRKNSNTYVVMKKSPPGKGFPWEIADIVDDRALVSWKRVSTFLAKIPIPFTSSDHPHCNKPQRAVYINVAQNPSAFMFNPELDIPIEHIRLDHMLGGEERLDRLPKKFQNLCIEELNARFNFGIANTISTAKAYPRRAVPQLFRRRGHGAILQLLLPLNLDFGQTTEAHCAVTLEFVPDTNYSKHLIPELRGYYRVETVLKLSMARNNARLLQPLDQDWLIKSSKGICHACGQNKTEDSSNSSNYFPPLSCKFPPASGKDGKEEHKETTDDLGCCSNSTNQALKSEDEHVSSSKVENEIVQNVNVTISRLLNEGVVTLNPTDVKQEQRSKPKEGYTCKICGTKGGKEESHWVIFCPVRTHGMQN